ncbi:PREDICTED: probable polygalacturonase At3g15720 [Fragaria vesca subsp. vesca]|uniref:probable polygalacturonase At3g15720 n=1 Tax=Fragaria vesca subsp. vesca TaxID=101020 RepID=UPI0002C336C9|nr:PREDICTED: probable polygalacturonase At3g15720 [Fragaria vesca subsp. vesca]
MEGRVVAMIFLLMIILVASPSPSSCARLNGFPTTTTLRDDDSIGVYGDQVATVTSNSFNNKKYGDVFATPYRFHEYRPLSSSQTSDDLQAFPEADGTSTFNVMNYGAIGNDQFDNTQVCLSESMGIDVCGSTQDIPTLIIPKDNNFLLSSVEFKGPCKAASVNFQLNGNIVAPNDTNAWGDNKGRWVQFDQVQGLIINEGGQIDGQGQALHFDSCDGLRLSNITHINSAKNHITITSCNDVQISDILIRAPDESPNTDGINISTSTNITIQRSFIGTGNWNQIS